MCIRDSYSEDPGNNFLPVTGKLIAFEPTENPLVRWDTGVETGSEITPNFDPMLAKVISYGENRVEAANKLALALENSHFGGLKTNRDYLISILRSDEFLQGNTTTDFLEKAKIKDEINLSEKEIYFLAIAASLWIQGKNRFESEVLSNLSSGWNNARLPMQEVKLQYKDKPLTVKYKNNREGIFTTDNNNLAKIISWDKNFIDIEIDNVRIRSKITYEDDLLLIQSKSGDVLFKILPKFETVKKVSIDGGLNAPMPGKVVEVKIKKGAKIKKGDTLVILEAMKMEHKVLAPSDGKVKEILIHKDEQVENGATLVVLD